MKMCFFTSPERLIKVAVLCVSMGIAMGLSNGAYAEDSRIPVSEALKKAEKLVDGPILSLHFDRLEKKAVYIVEYLSQGLPTVMELDAKTGKQLKSKAVVKNSAKPKLSKALDIANKQLEGKVESIEFEPKSGDYLLELKQEKGHSYVVIDGDSFKLKAIEQSFKHINKHLNFLGADEFDIEVYSGSGAFPVFLGGSAESFHDLKSLNNELGAELQKELSIICESHAEKSTSAE